MPLPQPILDWLMPLSRFEHLFNRMQHELRDDLNARANETSRNLQNQLISLNHKLERLMIDVSKIQAAADRSKAGFDSVMAVLAEQSTQLKALADQLAAAIAASDPVAQQVVQDQLNAIADGLNAEADAIAAATTKPAVTP